MFRAAIAASFAVVVTMVLATNASAAPPEQVEIDCGADGTFMVLVNGNGQFTPGKIVGGGVVIPVGFSNQHAVFTDNEGHVFEEFPPDVVKGNGNPGKNKDLVECDFAVTFEDENGTGAFSGTVTAYIVGR